MDVAQVSALISLVAVCIAGYGIFERGKAAKRSERVRLTSIIEEIAKTNYELVELTEHGYRVGDKLIAIHSRQEVLTQQAVSLIQGHTLAITSTELRVVALTLEETGYRQDAAAMWEMAIDNSQAEGETQALFASRGYAYFLFRSQREADAREFLQNALSRHPTDTDAYRVEHAQTLRNWATWEIEVQGPETPIVARLSRQIDKLVAASSTPRGRVMTAQHAFRIIDGKAESTSASSKSLVNHHSSDLRGVNWAEPIRKYLPRNGLATYRSLQPPTLKKLPFHLTPGESDQNTFFVNLATSVIRE